MIAILLLMRQKLATEGKEGFSLEDQEKLEGKSFEQLVKESHRKFSRYR